MGRNTEDFNELLGNGFSREDASDIANSRTLSAALDEDEEYLREQDALELDEEQELDGYDDTLFENIDEEDDDYQEEIDFDSYSFSDEEGAGDDY